MSKIKFLELDEYLKIIPKYKKWKEQEYRNTYWNTDDLPSITKKIINSATLAHSSINRERVFQVSSRFSSDTLNTITSVITILDEITKKTIICGFVYSSHLLVEKYKKISLGVEMPYSVIYSDDTISNYWNIGPSLESVDGEYRNQFSDFYGLKKCQIHYKKVYEKMIDYVKKKIKERKYLFHRETFYPTAKIKQTEINIDKHFKNFQIELNLYLMVWFVGVYQKFTNIRENHINERYVVFIDKHMTEDIEFFKELIKEFSLQTMETIYRYFENTCLPGKEHVTVLGFGQKLMPLNLLEVQKPFDVRFVPWRDYIISQALTNLVVNNICPGFPVVNSWIYIKGAKKGLFNNKIQYQKIERSDQAQAIIELLIKSKSYTYENIKTDMKDQRGTITSWLSDKFKVLHDQIDDAVNFGKNEIIMSNVSFMIISEYTGRTLNDVMRLTKSSPYYNEALGKPFTSGGYKYFKKYVFDICYNLHCMFENYGIIHGDLHLNNLTLYQKFQTNHEGFDKVDDPHVLYVVGENNEYNFVLPSTAFHTTLIDFGRCFIHPDYLEKLRDPSVPERYSITGDKDKFIKEQTRRLINTYIKLVPDSKDQEPELRVLFAKNFDAMYKLMSVSDLYSVMTKLQYLINMGQKDVVVPHANCVFLIKKVIDLCSIYLISDVSKLISDKSYGDAINESKSPLLEIMVKLFSDNLDQAGKNIIDVFLFNNPKKYSMSFLSKIPSVVDTKKYVDQDGKLVEFSSHGSEYVKRMRLEYEKSRATNYDIVDLIARRHKEKIF